MMNVGSMVAGLVVGSAATATTVLSRTDQDEQVGDWVSSM